MFKSISTNKNLDIFSALSGTSIEKVLHSPIPNKTRVPKKNKTRVPKNGGRPKSQRRSINIIHSSIKNPASFLICSTAGEGTFSFVDNRIFASLRAAVESAGCLR